jgi:hypothetical protein
MTRAGDAARAPEIGQGFGAWRIGSIRKMRTFILLGTDCCGLTSTPGRAHTYMLFGPN